MSDSLKAVWRDQPEIVAEHGRRLHAVTRSEILTAVSAMVLFALVLLPRFGLNPVAVASLAVAVVSAMLMLYALRRRVRRLSSEAFAVSGVEFYRAELEERRRHLMNPWLWHGPLLLALVTMGVVMAGTGHLAYRRWPEVLPLVVVLVVWTYVRVRHRRGQIEAIQRELDELGGGESPEGLSGFR